MNESPNERDRIADDIARQLLGRAAALDQDGPSLAQLREAAIEAGISGTAFDEAVREWRTATHPAGTSVAWPRRTVRNLGAFAGGWAALAGLAAMDRLLAVPWLVHALTDPIGLFVGAIIATKLRARAAAVVMGGLAVAQAAEFIVDWIAGAPAVHGLYAHLALMVAGVAGVAVSQVWRSRGGRTDASSVPPADAGAIPPTPDAQDTGPGESRSGWWNKLLAAAAEAERHIDPLLHGTRTEQRRIEAHALKDIANASGERGGVGLLGVR